MGIEASNTSLAKIGYTPASPLFDPDATGQYLGGISRLTLADWRCKRVGPPFVKVGRLVRYRQEDLDAWLNSRVVAAR